MSAVRLYVDEDASETSVVRGLRARGIDTLTTADAGRLGAADADQLAFAAAQKRTIYTFNVGDFVRLHRQYLERGLRHAGIVVVPDQRCSVGEKVRRVARFVHSVTPSTWSIGWSICSPKRADGLEGLEPLRLDFAELLPIDIPDVDAPKVSDSNPAWLAEDHPLREDQCPVPPVSRSPRLPEQRRRGDLGH